MYALRVENLTKTYKKINVLDSLSFSIEKNTINCFMGLDELTNTFLAKILSLTSKPTSGDIYYFDSLKNHLNNYDNDVSLMPSTLGLSEHLTVYENLVLMAQLRHIKVKGIKELVVEYMNKYGLSDRLDDKVKTLSPSLKKLVSFVLTIMADTTVVILDEPFKDIDIKTKRMLIEYIKELKAIKTFIIFNEIPDTALELADNIYFLNSKSLEKVDNITDSKELEKLLLNAEVR